MSIRTTPEFLQDNLRVFVVPVEILEVDGLSIYEKMTYIVIRSHANAREATAFPSYSTIAKEASMSRRKAIDAVAALVEKGLLRKEIRLDVSKNRKIRNTSNLYKLEHPAAAIQKPQPSAHHAPPPVHTMHHPSAPHAPEHNHLTDPYRNMIDCARATAEIAAAAESLFSGPDPIYEALNEHVKQNCFILNNVPLTQAYIDEIYIMLINQFPHQLDAAVVKDACEIYFGRVCEIRSPEGVVMKIEVKNPVGLFQTCYKDAVKAYKAKNAHRGTMARR